MCFQKAGGITAALSLVLAIRGFLVATALVEWQEQKAGDTGLKSKLAIQSTLTGCVTLKPKD